MLRTVESKPTIRIYVAKTSDYLSSDFYPSAIKNELEKTSSKSVIVQKYSVWGLVRYAFKDFFNEELDGEKVYKNQFGKPMYSDKNINYSFTHKNDVLAVAVSVAKVGVDIEEIKTERVDLRLKNRVLTESEIKSCVDETSFYSYWTKKEAIFKLNGNSDCFSPKNIPVDLFTTESFFLKTDDKEFCLSVASDVVSGVEIVLLGDIKKF